MYLNYLSIRILLPLIGRSRHLRPYIPHTPHARFYGPFFSWSLGIFSIHPSHTIRLLWHFIYTCTWYTDSCVHYQDIISHVLCLSTMQRITGITKIMSDQEVKDRIVTFIFFFRTMNSSILKKRSCCFVLVNKATEFT